MSSERAAPLIWDAIERYFALLQAHAPAERMREAILTDDFRTCFVDGLIRQGEQGLRSFLEARAEFFDESHIVEQMSPPERLHSGRRRTHTRLEFFLRHRIDGSAVSDTFTGKAFHLWAFAPQHAPEPAGAPRHAPADDRRADHGADGGRRVAAQLVEGFAALDENARRLFARPASGLHIEEEHLPPEDHTVHTLLPVVFALGAALSNAVATVLQRRAALSVPRSDGFRARLMLDLLRHPVWLAGILTVIVAAVCQAVALATGPLTIVQPLFVLELPLTLIVASLLMRRHLPRAGWLAVTGVVAGLAVALAAASPEGNRTHVPLDRWLPALAVCTGAVVLLALAALKRPEGRARAACLGTATAISYALTAALMKAAMHILDDDGIAAFFTAWQTYAFAAFGAGALFLLENALQAGPLVASQPAITLGDATVSMALGIIIYEEHVRSGWWLLPQLLGLAMIATGVLVLSRIPLTQSVVAAPDEPAQGADIP